MMQMELVSHALCPYVQRAAITLAEKQVPFTRRIVDLADKPGWFTAISPLGKVPLLRVGEDVLFESAAICDYLDETLMPRLHPADPVARARHRAWIEVASATLNDIWRFYTATEAATFAEALAAIALKFDRLEAELERHDGPYFAGGTFSLVDAAFAPVFRYFDIFDRHVAHGAFDGRPRLAAWRRSLAERPSVRAAVAPDYPALLDAFLRQRPSHLARRMQQAA
ncbi:glutathione S-transferase family protein [Ferrovibrio sp.]|uniref:glutathione S-transferase family protein n=1 Tax=Ferrovibrio sp. TaxID=1917215 RepID=UPI003514D9A4